MGISEADRAEVHALVAALKAKVRAEAPPEQRDAATELVDELEDAILAEAPKVRRMAFIRDWFSAHLPKLAGAVSELVAEPARREDRRRGGRSRRHRVPQRLRSVSHARSQLGDPLTTRS